MEIESEAVAGRPARKGAQTAERILDAAEALFAEHGFAGTTLREIAAVVGLRNPSLYNHFPSKEVLYAAVLERGLSPLLEALAGFAQDEDSDSRGALQVERLMELLSQRPNLPRLIQYEALAGGEHLSPLLRKWIRPLLAQAQGLIEDSPAASRWEPEEIPLLVLAMYHVVIGYFTVAPLYKDLNDEDLMTEAARAKQTRFLQSFVEVLFINGSARDEHQH